MPKPADLQRRMLAPQAQENLHIREDLLLLRCAAGCCEGSFGIARPATGKITPIVGVAPAGHANFVAIIKLGNPSKSERQAKCEFDFRQRTSLGARKAGHVMI